MCDEEDDVKKVWNGYEIGILFHKVYKKLMMEQVHQRILTRAPTEYN